MVIYLYKIGTTTPVLTIADVLAWTDSYVQTTDGTVYGPFQENYELSADSGCTQTLRAKWKKMHPETLASAQASSIYVSKLCLDGETVDTDDKRLRASGLYPEWAPGVHPAGEIVNADGQTWEVFAAYDNATHPEIRPGEAAWYTFNRPLHGTSPETARPWVQPQHGATDIYHTGEYMVWPDGTLYRCLRSTDYSPKDYEDDWEIISNLYTEEEG